MSTTTIFGLKTVEFKGGNDYNIVSADINNIFMVVVNGGNPRVIQMPARKIGQIIMLRSIANPGVSNAISVSLISGGNFIIQVKLQRLFLILYPLVALLVILITVKIGYHFKIIQRDIF